MINKVLEFIDKQLCVGTAFQTTGFYLMISVLVCIIIMQKKMIEKKKLNYIKGYIRGKKEI